MRRLFTLAAAQACLSSIRPAAERMLDLYRELAAHRPRPRGDTPVARGYYRRLVVLLATLDEIERTGAEVSDLARGLVDFPVRRAGRVVHLCWQVGEPAIAFWHEAADGSVGARRPLDEDGPWDQGGAPQD